MRYVASFDMLSGHPGAWAYFPKTYDILFFDSPLISLRQLIIHRAMECLRLSCAAPCLRISELWIERAEGGGAEVGWLMMMSMRPSQRSRSLETKRTRSPPLGRQRQKRCQTRSRSLQFCTPITRTEHSFRRRVSCFCRHATMRSGLHDEVCRAFSSMHSALYFHQA